MLEALWSVEFVSNAGIVGAGVAVFESGRVYGGDGQYYYVGTYEVKDSHVSARIAVNHYSGTPYSVFGMRESFAIVAAGDIGQRHMEVRGHLEDDKNMEIAIRLTRRAELP